MVMVVAQLAEQLLLAPEICSSNPEIDKYYLPRAKKDATKEKEPVFKKS